MKITFWIMLGGVATLLGCAAPQPVAHNTMPAGDPNSYFMPDAAAQRWVTVTTNGTAPASLLVQTHAVAVKETGPRETVAKFGEVYAFSPAFLAVYQDEPTRLRFWNLQGDDNHDLMLVAPDATVLLKVLLPPLQETSMVFTFHEAGIYGMYCAMHQPAMSGQILVLPPRKH